MTNRWGAFELEQLIAVGGLGEVWRARLGNQVGALKRLHTHLARNDEARGIFAQEQELAMTLPRFPGLVRGLSRGDVDGLPFVLLELAPGHDLRRIVAPPASRERPTPSTSALPRERAIAIVAAAADVVAHVHAQGWVHGDVNPANLIVDDADHVTLVDLGIARRIGEGGTPRGTHAYMAPEQVRGEAWSARTDVFALGVVLWELLGNARLFHRGPPWLSMAAVVEAEVPPLADRALDAIARAALVKDLAQRTPSASELATQLRALTTN